MTIVPSSPSMLLQISPSRLAGCIVVILLIALYADLENLDLNWESMNAEISCSVVLRFLFDPECLSYLSEGHASEFLFLECSQEFVSGTGFLSTLKT